MRAFAGIDVGSLCTKVVILRGEEVLSWSLRRTGADPVGAARRCFDEALARAGLQEEELGGVVATGYGRLRIPFASKQVTEITCHARGAHFLFPKTRTVIDIGGQDAKVIALDERGKVLDFVMNDKCAAGTGRFLEVMAQALEMEIEEMASEAANALKAVPISSMCTVFAESEVISLVAEGSRRDEIVWGLHRAIARRILGMAKRLPMKGEVTFTGGVAKNRGMVRALRELLGMPLNIPHEPQIVGALGAALLASSTSPSVRAAERLKI